MVEVMKVWPVRLCLEEKEIGIVLDGVCVCVYFTTRGL